jgi:hypothetical protein
MDTLTAGIERAMAELLAQATDGHGAPVAQATPGGIVAEGEQPRV